MRVLVVAPPYLPVPPDGYGGTEMVLDALCRGLRHAGDDVLLVATGDSTCPVPSSWAHPRAVGVGQGGADAEVVQAAHAYGIAEEWEPDVIHDHTVVGPLLGSVRCDVPIVTTNHGPFATPEARYRYRALDPRITVVAISRHQASTAPAGVRVDAVIPHGIDVDAVVPGDGSGGFALFLGRMHPTKGVDRAVRIAHRAGMPLVIAAKMREPHERRYFEEEVQPLLGPADDVVGEVAGSRKQDVLRRAAVLLNPLRWHEPFGLVMIEALAAGTPVVATPNGAVPEIVDDGETGFVCSGDDELAAALRRAAALDRATCRAVARQRFGRDRMVSQHRQLYRRVADGRREVYREVSAR